MKRISWRSHRPLCLSTSNPPECHGRSREASSMVRLRGKSNTSCAEHFPSSHRRFYSHCALRRQAAVRDDNLALWHSPSRWWPCHSDIPAGKPKMVEGRLTLSERLVRQVRRLCSMTHKEKAGAGHAVIRDTQHHCLGRIVVVVESDPKLLSQRGDCLGDAANHP